MKDYYKILEVDQNASNTDIKKAFRKLAVQHHPDKSTKQNALVLFQEINEAYQILSDPEQRRAYDVMRTFGIDLSQLEEAVAPPPRRRPYQYRPPRPKPEEIIKPYLKYLHWTSRIGLVLCLLLTIDFFLPVTQQAVYLSNGLMPYLDQQKEIVEENGYPLSYPDKLKFPAGTAARVYKTPMFTTFVYIEREDNRFVAKAAYNIYKNFIFAPVALLIVSLFGILVRGNVDLEFKLAVVSFLLTLLTGFILIILN
jgi:hypothetical protein